MCLKHRGISTWRCVHCTMTIIHIEDTPSSWSPCFSSLWSYLWVQEHVYVHTYIRLVCLTHMIVVALKDPPTKRRPHGLKGKAPWSFCSECQLCITEVSKVLTPKSALCANVEFLKCILIDKLVTVWLIAQHPNPPSYPQVPKTKKGRSKGANPRTTYFTDLPGWTVNIEWAASVPPGDY